MLDARDKWLRPGGLIIPDKCSIFIACMVDHRYRTSVSNYWTRVYDFSMIAIRDALLREPALAAVNRNEVRLVTECRSNGSHKGKLKYSRLTAKPNPNYISQVASDACKIIAIDFYTATKSDLQQIDGVFRLRIYQMGCISAFLTFFEVEFNECHVPVILSMGPESLCNHWSQSLFFAPDAMYLPVTKNDEIYGAFRLISKPDDFRHFDFRIDVCYRGGSRQTFFKDSAQYEMR